MPTTTRQIDFSFRKMLDEVLEGDHHNYCYQCGACVAVCPVTRFRSDFNPRLIVLNALCGQEDVLLGPDSVLWLCTNCYSCYERCPQDVRPVEVIIALKNLAAAKGTAPSDLSKFADVVSETGYSARITHSVNERRKRLGLPELKKAPTDEIRKILSEESET